MDAWFRRCDSFAEEAEADREYWQQFSGDERIAIVDDLRHDWPEMEAPNADHADFLAALARHGARALIVGAHALAFHAKPRFTKDLDIFVEATGRVAQVGDPPNRIDLITAIDGVTFEEAWNGRVEGVFAGQPVFFLGKAELIRNKRASAHPQDLVDLDLLRRF